jgi:hypothetical protein
MRQKAGVPKTEHALMHNTSMCIMCQGRHDFVLPSHLLKQLSDRKVVIFAGAGVSTETPLVFPWTFYDEIHKKLGLATEDKPAFPKLMSLFCQRPDGRRELVEKIRARLNYVGSFPGLYRVATRFHRELSTFLYIDTYCTTNWDDYFERECGATPFVNAEDFAFWQTSGRKVFKLHGSVSNFGSIVATDEDYKHAERQLQRGTLGAALKLMLATQTIVYVGYSFSDHDFIKIHRYISRELKAVAPVAYIVSPDRSAEARFKALGLTPIFTDATHFIEVLKKHFEADGHSLPDARLSAIPYALARVKSEHNRLHEAFETALKPEIIYCAAYQDGLMDAFGRILSRVHAGDYCHQCEIAAQCRKYESIRAENLRAQRYVDVAYIDGYISGLWYLVADDESRRSVPFYFVFGLDDQPLTLTAYKKAIMASPTPHKSAKALAARIVRRRLGPGDDFHHTPFLTWEAESE